MPVMAKDARTRTDIPVAEGEEPWTQEELDEIHDELIFEIGRMERAIKTAEATMASLFDEGTEGAGRDPADVGSTNFERDQEMSLVQNARDMLEQAQSALHRFETVLAQRPDLVISVGTGSAFPYIAGPVLAAAGRGDPTIEINPGGTHLSELVTVRLRMRAAEALPAILDAAGYSLDSGRDACS